jgi:hypothetical protein
VADSATYGEATGKIRTIAQAVIDGNTHFYVTLEGDDGIYDFVLPGLIGIVSYQEGDQIGFTYIENQPTNTVSEITKGSGAGIEGVQATADEGGEADAAEAVDAAETADAAA